MRDWCDLAYVLCLERVEDRDAFDTWLNSEPPPARWIAPEEADLLEAFGLRRPA